MSEESPEYVTLKIEWLKDAAGNDVVGLDAEGVVYFVNSKEGTTHAASQERWLKCQREYWDMEQKISGLERAVNAREPSRWVEDCTRNLAEDARKLETVSHELIRGMVMGLRVAIASIGSYVKP